MDYFADLSTKVLRLFFHYMDASKSITSSLHLLCKSYSRPNKGKLLLNIEVVFMTVHFWLYNNNKKINNKNAYISTSCSKMVERKRNKYTHNIIHTQVFQYSCITMQLVEQSHSAADAGGRCLKDPDIQADHLKTLVLSNATAQSNFLFILFL